ncbi:hypothetical protein MRX96_033621 [Rhipicephalus microplus]
MDCCWMRAALPRASSAGGEASSWSSLPWVSAAGHTDRSAAAPNPISAAASTKSSSGCRVSPLSFSGPRERGRCPAFSFAGVARRGGTSHCFRAHFVEEEIASPDKGRGLRCQSGVSSPRPVVALIQLAP